MTSTSVPGGFSRSTGGTAWTSWGADTARCGDGGGGLDDCATLYARAGDQGKRRANQALTNGIEISEDEMASIRLAEPFAALAPTTTSTDVRCSSTSEIVDLRVSGFTT